MKKVLSTIAVLISAYFLMHGLLANNYPEAIFWLLAIKIHNDNK